MAFSIFISHEHQNVILKQDSSVSRSAPGVRKLIDLATQAAYIAVNF